MACSQSLILVDQTGVAANVTGDTLSIPPKSNQFLGRIKARNVNAATTVVGKIQHSPDGVVWFDAVTFTSIVGASADEVKATTLGNMFLYVRVTLTVTGVTKLADVLVDLWFDPKVA